MPQNKTEEPLIIFWPGILEGLLKTLSVIICTFIGADIPAHLHKNHLTQLGDFHCIASV